MSSHSALFSSAQLNGKFQPHSVTTLIHPTCPEYYTINPHTVVKKIHPNPVLRGPHGPWQLFWVKCYSGKVTISITVGSVRTRTTGWGLNKSELDVILDTSTGLQMQGKACDIVNCITHDLLALSLIWSVLVRWNDSVGDHYGVVASCSSPGDCWSSSHWRSAYL